MGVYPALILFPAEKKIPVPYEGDMAVVDIIKFIAEHGSNFNDLISDKGNYFRESCTFKDAYGLPKRN